MAKKKPTKEKEAPDYDSMTWKKLDKLSNKLFEKLSSVLDDEDIETLNQYTEVERALTLKEEQP